VSGEEFIEKAAVISAVREYETGRTRRKEKVVDFTVSPSEADEKILIRVITKTKSKSGFVGVDAVRDMNDVLEKRDYDAMITHLPFDYGFPDAKNIAELMIAVRKKYSRGLEKLEKIIKEYPNVPVIVHTGAAPDDVPSYVLDSIGVKKVVRKNIPKKDIENLRKALNEIL